MLNTVPLSVLQCLWPIHRSMIVSVLPFVFQFSLKTAFPIMQQTALTLQDCDCPQVLALYNNGVLNAAPTSSTMHMFLSSASTEVGRSLTQCPGSVTLPQCCLFSSAVVPLLCLTMLCSLNKTLLIVSWSHITPSLTVHCPEVSAELAN